MINSLMQRVDAGAEAENAMRQNEPDIYKSYLQTRLIVGIVGLLLPTMLITFDLVGDSLRREPLGLRGSLSAYYYGTWPLRDWFVGCLWAIGAGLLVYMGTRRSAANVISCAAGAAAIIVSLVPTTDEGTASTLSSNIHFAAAAVVVIGLAALCFGFGRDDQIRSREAKSGGGHAWVHYSCAAVITIGVLLVVVDRLLGWQWKYAVLVAELLAIFPFAVSWFVKGLEIRELRFRATRSAPGRTALEETDGLPGAPRPALEPSP